MARFDCENGHRGPAYLLVAKPIIAPGAEDASKMCPKCGADVKITPCNKHGGKPSNQRDGVGALRKPFSLGIVGMK